jgi:hypothetical protein
MVARSSHHRGPWQPEMLNAALKSDASGFDGIPNEFEAEPDDPHSGDASF